MTILRYVTRRLLWAVLTVYAAVTATYFLGRLTLRDEIRNQMALARRRGASPAEIEELKESLQGLYRLDDPVHEVLLDWYVDVATLQLGESASLYRPIADVLAGRILTTLEYVVPGVLLAVVLGVGLGLFAGLAENSRFDWSARLSSYLFLGVPVFMVLTYVTAVSGEPVGIAGLTLPRLNRLTIAALAVALGLLAGVLRFARLATLQQLRQAYVKTLRAKGAGRRRLARHVLRNAALPLLTLSITELLAVLVLNIYVIEAFLGIEGLAGASILAATESDVPLLIWSTLVIVVLGIVLSFLQDVWYATLDPEFL
ncbi:ABC transporter permease [Halobacteriales archaeon Cl-PHB]